MSLEQTLYSQELLKVKSETVSFLTKDNESFKINGVPWNAGGGVAPERITVTALITASSGGSFSGVATVGGEVVEITGGKIPITLTFDILNYLVRCTVPAWNCTGYTAGSSTIISITPFVGPALPVPSINFPPMQWPIPVLNGAARLLNGIGKVTNTAVTLQWPAVISTPVGMSDVILSYNDTHPT